MAKAGNRKYNKALISGNFQNWNPGFQTLHCSDQKPLRFKHLKNKIFKDLQTTKINLNIQRRQTFMVKIVKLFQIVTPAWNCYSYGKCHDVIGCFLMFRLKYLNNLNPIHPESQEDVNVARSHLNIALSDEDSNVDLPDEASLNRDNAVSALADLQMVFFFVITAAALIITLELQFFLTYFIKSIC